MSAAHWDAQAETLEGAKRAVWSEPDWDDSIKRSIEAIETGAFGRFLNSHSGLRVAEIGCGVGRVTLPMARRHPYSSLHGQDISTAMLARAEGSDPNLLATWGTYLPEHLDAAYSMLVFQHLPAVEVMSYIHSVAARLRSTGLFRFQFVEGDYHVDHDHRYPEALVGGWLGGAGLGIVDIHRGLMYPEWTWITAVKP